MNKLKIGNLNPLFKEVSKFTTKKLIELWDETEKVMMSIDNANIRDAIMQVLEARHNLEYNNWMNADYQSDDIKIYFNGVYS